MEGAGVAVARRAWAPMRCCMLRAFFIPMIWGSWSELPGRAHLPCHAANRTAMGGGYSYSWWQGKNELSQRAAAFVINDDNIGHPCVHPFGSTFRSACRHTLTLDKSPSTEVEGLRIHSTARQPCLTVIFAECTHSFFQLPTEILTSKTPKKTRFTAQMRIHEN